MRFRKRRKDAVPPCAVRVVRGGKKVRRHEFNHELGGTEIQRQRCRYCPMFRARERRFILGTDLTEGTRWVYGLPGSWAAGPWSHDQRVAS